MTMTGPVAMDPSSEPDSDGGPDLEGCEQGSRHCHSPRSPRQEDSRTAEGRIKACHNRAGFGTKHVGEGRCRLHGGNSPTYMKRIEHERARAAVVTYGLPKDIDPTTALLEEVQRTAGHVDWLAKKVQSLTEDELVWGVVEETTNWERNPDSESDGLQSADQTVKRRPETNAWLREYQKERAHLARVCRDAVAAGVSERIVNVFRQVGQTYIQMIDRVMEQMNLTDAQRLQLPDLMAQELRALMDPDGTYRVETED